MAVRLQGEVAGRALVLHAQPRIPISDGMHHHGLVLGWVLMAAQLLSLACRFIERVVRAAGLGQ